MFEAKQTHSGQYRRYGDTFLEWQVTTDKTIEETTEWCLSTLSSRNLPSAAEWRDNVRYGGARSGDHAYYFGGYYDIKPIDGGFRFIICYPYAD